jgi:alpha-L-fucosidase
LSTKHHEGFTLWPSTTPNPTLPAARQNASRDIVGELTAAVRQQGLKMGLYYSRGFDWTFVPGPIASRATLGATKPQSGAYEKYGDAQYHELIARYHPAVLWNDIDYPKSAPPAAIEAEFYNAVPDGAVYDRFGFSHSDCTSPEYFTRKQTNRKKSEEWRGLARPGAAWDRHADRTAPTGGADHRPRQTHQFDGRHFEQERQPSPRCRPGS